MNHRAGRLVILASILGMTVALAVFGIAFAQSNPNEREVKPQANVQDFDDISAPESKIWVLDFKFKDPRLIKANIPGRGQKICWYLWYQVINNTKEPRTFLPEFELVTLDRNTVHHDQVLPSVQEAIRQLEDSDDKLKIKNSVTIFSEPIPVSKPDALPKPVTGVAIWDDVDPDANRFSIFVSGLSNGWSETDPIPPDTQRVVRRKTLQLNFRRVGERYNMRSEDIKFVPPAQWIYRGSKLDLKAPPSPREATPPAPPARDK